MFSFCYYQVLDDNDQPLSAVLLSLSAGQFRSNNLTLDNGSMVFANLVSLDFMTALHTQELLCSNKLFCLFCRVQDSTFSVRC